MVNVSGTMSVPLRLPTTCGVCTIQRLWYCVRYVAVAYRLWCVCVCVCVRAYASVCLSERERERERERVCVCVSERERERERERVCVCVCMCSNASTPNTPRGMTLALPTLNAEIPRRSRDSSHLSVSRMWCVWDVSGGFLAAEGCGCACPWDTLCCISCVSQVRAQYV